MSITLLSGDCRDVLPTLAADSVHTCVTSPPYYALRDYNCAGQIGLEATPDEYLRTMVAVFREVRRVLRPDGTAFVNMGDGYRDKQLQMIPARLAIALQADGWFLRSAIIWAKPNPMPESVTDRPTSAYEHVFLLTKRSRYYFDAEAVREELTGNTHFNWSGETPIERAGYHGANRRGSMSWPVTSRNMRNVWTIATHAYPQAHFATYPPELAERCIRAGTSERGCCSACGAPWRRVVENGGYTESTSHNYAPCPNKGNLDGFGQRVAGMTAGGFVPNRRKITTTTGWSASCACAAPTQPCTVLDPFAGAGTTLLVADRLQRNAVGIELNADYTTMAMERCRADAPLFSSADSAIQGKLCTTYDVGFAQADLFAEAAD